MGERVCYKLKKEFFMILAGDKCTAFPVSAEA